VVTPPDNERSRPAGDGRIVVSGLSKRYGSVTAVDDLSFVVEPGRVTGFLGPNGAGKTTTLRILLGLVAPGSGSATIGGRRYADFARPLSVVGAVLEASSAHPARSGRDHLRIIGVTTGVARSRADEVLAMVGLASAARRRIRTYSLGMRQRLAIGAAMIGDPEVLILDEPFNGLDPDGIRWMRELLAGIAAGGRTVLVSSHILSEMETFADDLVIISGGRLVARGTVADITTSPTTGGAVSVRTPGASELAVALAQRGATVTVAGDGRLTITGMSAAEVGNTAAVAGIELHDLTTHRAHLEDVFLDLTRSGGAAR
jgi:ABC-2 type transport system ATP-binding protein